MAQVPLRTRRQQLADLGFDDFKKEHIEPDTHLFMGYALGAYQPGFAHTEDVKHFSAPRADEFSRLASDTGSAEQIIFLTPDCARSTPCSATRFARCNAKLGIEISTVGSSDCISARCAADYTELPAPTQFIPTPASCAERAQIWPAGRADLVALARPHLTNPHFTLEASAWCGHTAQRWPTQYGPAKDQAMRFSQREKANADELLRAAAPASYRDPEKDQKEKGQKLVPAQ